MATFPNSILAPTTTSLPRFFSSYITTVIEQDVRFAAQLSNLHLFQSFIALCTTLTAQEVNPSHLGRELGIANKTARFWLNILLATYQWHEIRAFSTNSSKRLSIKKTKGYLSDTGIACSLLQIDGPQTLISHKHRGALFETWVVNSIIQQLQALPDAKACLY